MFEKPPHASGHCRYYSYSVSAGAQCAKAVDLSFPGAPSMCMPGGLGCSLRQDYTDAERQAWQEWQDACLNRVRVIMPHIPDKGSEGKFSCPACKLGTVQWSRHERNNHVWASCSTPSCFRVMQ